MIGSLIERTRLLVHQIGFDVRRDQFRHRVLPALAGRGIDGVIDIGANAGQFGQDLRRAGFHGRIVSVEPLGDPYKALEARASQDALWTVERAAVADETGTLTVNVSANSVSSSVLRMLDRHTTAAPSSRYVGVEEVEATTVDDLVARHALTPATTLLKIDVQGYEHAVLDGAADSLPRFGAIRTELSLAPLYEGQALMGETLDRLAAAGFELWMIEPGFVDPHTHRLLQVDGTFLRTSD